MGRLIGQIPELFTGGVNAPGAHADFMVTPTTPGAKSARLSRAEQVRIAATAAATVAVLYRAALYDADEPRDDQGRWTAGGGGGVTTAADLNRPRPSAHAPDKNAPRAATVVAPKGAADVQRFLGDVANTYEHREITRRFDAYRAKTKSGDVTRYSLEQNTGPDGKPTAARQKLYDRIFAKFQTAESLVPAGVKPVAVFTLGPPGAGKSTALKMDLVKASILGGKPLSAFVNVNADDIKAEFPEYRGWNAGLVHEESSKLAKELVKSSMKLGAQHNIIYDATGSDPEKFAKMVGNMEKAGYEVRLVHMATPPEIAVGWAWKRFIEGGGLPQGGKAGGRFVDPQFSYTVDHKPDKTYALLKTLPNVKSWVSVNAAAPGGPKIVDKGGR